MHTSCRAAHTLPSGQRKPLPHTAVSLRAHAVGKTSTRARASARANDRANDRASPRGDTAPGLERPAVHRHTTGHPADSRVWSQARAKRHSRSMVRVDTSMISAIWAMLRPAK